MSVLSDSNSITLNNKHLTDNILSTLIDVNDFTIDEKNDLIDRILLAVWTLSLKKYPSPLSLIYGLITALKTEPLDWSLQAHIRSLTSLGDEKKVNEVLIIADYDLDKTHEANLENFNYYRSRLCSALAKLNQPVVEIDDLLYSEETTAPLFACQEIEAPAWFVLNVLHFQETTVNNNYKSTSKMIDCYLNMTFDVPLTHSEITLGPETDLMIKNASRERKIDGLSTQIRNVNARINKLTLFDEHNSKIAFLRKEVKMLNEKRDLLRFMMKPSMEMPNEIDMKISQENNTAIEIGNQDALGEIVLFNEAGELPSSVITDQVHSYGTLTDRWVNIATIPITTSINDGDILKEIHLPYDLLKNNWDSPNALPFRSHDFYSGGMKIKATWNVPKSNQMMIIGGIVPHLLQKDRPEDYQNEHTTSQQAGFSLVGHANSSAEIEVDFLSYLGSIPIHETDIAMNLYNVTLTIIAMSKYQVAEGANDHAELIIYGAFKDDLMFYGQREQVHAFPTNTDLEFYRQHKVQKGARITKKFLEQRMQPAMPLGTIVAAGAAIGVSKSISNTITDTTGGLLKPIINKITTISKPSAIKNHDKVTDHNVVSFIQRTTPNIASGACNFAAESFRLRSEAETTHDPSFFGEDKIAGYQDLMNTFGYITKFEIKSSDSHGQELFAMKVQPGDPNPFLHGSQAGNSVANFSPLDHVASHFQNYHGKQEIKMVVNTDGFKTFRFRVAFIASRSTLSYKDSTSCYWAVINIDPSLESGLIHTFTIPYITPFLAFPSKQVHGNNNHLGSVHFFLENPISAPPNLYDSVQVFLFKRAKPGYFTFSVPIPNRTSFLSASNLKMVRYHLAVVANQLTISLVGIPNSSVSVPSNLSATYTLTSKGMTRFRTPSATYRWAGLQTVGITATVTVVANSSFSIFFHFLQGDYGVVGHFASVLHLDFETSDYPTLTMSSALAEPTEKPSMPSTPSGQGDHRFDTGTVIDLVPDKANPDLLIYGETHMVMEDNLRRFENYITSSPIDVAECTEFQRVYSLPASFGAPQYRDITPRYSRNNKITHLHDCFLCSRGCLNYVVTVVPAHTRGAICFIHQPQDSDLPLTPDEQYANGSYDLGGYGENILALTQNLSVPLEIPCYLGTRGVLNSSYNSDELAVNLSKALGVVEMYYMGAPNTLSINVRRALGNDVVFSNFIGFPKREKTHMVENKSIDLGKRNHFARRMRPSMSIWDDVKTAAKGMASVNYERINSSLEVLTQAAGKVGDVSMESQNFIRMLTNAGGDGKILATIILQVTQVITNPTKSSAIIAVAQVLVSAGILSMINFETFKSLLSKIWTKISGKDKQTVNEIIADFDEAAELAKRDENDFNLGAGTSERMAAPGAYDGINSIITDTTEMSALLISGVSSFIGMHSEIGFPQKLILSFTKGATMHDRVLRAIQQIFHFVGKVTKFIAKKYVPESELLKWLENDDLDLWLKRVPIFVDETVFGHIKKNKDAIAVVFMLIEEGEKYEEQMCKSHVNNKFSRLVSLRLRELKAVRRKLANEVNVPIVKYNPFALYLAGKSNIGKSKLIQALAPDLMPLCPGFDKYDKEQGPFIVPMNKYWDLYHSNACIVMDDFGRIQDVADKSESDHARFCDLKGSAQCVVPKADLESKGMVSTAKLILCASNFLYPRVNGILRNVIHSRRDSTWAVKQTSFPPGCEKHEDKACNNCSFCGIAPGYREYLQAFKHLSFMQVPNMEDDDSYPDIPDTIKSAREQLEVEESFLMSDEPYPKEVEVEKPRHSKHVPKKVNVEKDAFVGVDYETFITTVKNEMKAYHEKAMLDYTESLSTALGVPIDQIYEYIIPNRPFQRIRKDLSSTEINKVITSMGGQVPGIISERPAMWTIFSSTRWFGLDLTADQPDAPPINNDKPVTSLMMECAHIATWRDIFDENVGDANEVLKLADRRIKFMPDRHILVHEEVDGTELKQTALPSNVACNRFCQYHNGGEIVIMSKYMQTYADKLTQAHRPFPRYLPRRFWREDNKIQLVELRAELNKRRYIKKIKEIMEIVGVVAAIAIPFLGLMYFTNFQTNKLIESVQEAQKFVADSKSLFPCLPSGDIYEESGNKPVKKMVNRRKFNANYQKRDMKAAMNPTCEGELMDMYERNTIEIWTCGVLTAQCLHLCGGHYYTQAHAMYNTLNSWSVNFLKYLNEHNITYKDSDALKKAHEKNRIEIRWSKNNMTYSAFITMTEFMKQNNNLTLFCGEHDAAIFTLKHDNLPDSGVFQNTIGNEETYDPDNIVLVRHRIGVWHDVRRVTNVSRCERPQVYSAKDCTWAESYGLVKDGAIHFRLDGFQCDNIYGADAGKMCGSVLVDHSSGKILGVLCATTGDQLFFDAISKEAITDYGVHYNTMTRMVPVVNEVCKMALPETLSVETFVPREVLHHTTKTALVQSPLYEQLGEAVKTPSCIEKDGDRGVKSFIRGISAYHPHHDFDFSLDEVYEDLENQFTSMRTDLPFVSKRTPKESITGIEAKVKRIHMNTSPGYPFCNIPELQDKRKLLIYKDDQLQGIHPKLHSILEREYEMMDNNIDVPTIFQISHKDELLKDPEKVRLIQGSPLSLTIHMRQYFMDFNYAFQYDRWNLQHCVGINDMSRDWDTLARRLLTKGDKILVGDFSKFGPRLYTNFVSQAYEIMNAWYASKGAPEQDQKIRRALAKRMINSKNMAYDRVVQVQCGSPSGAINTVVINSMCNMMYFRTAWVGLMKDTPYAGLHHFKDHVELFVYGDDVIASVSDSVCDLFNNETISEFFAKYDIKYTDVLDKNGKVRKWCSLLESQFLQKGFKLYTNTCVPGGMYITQPNQQNVLNITNWVRRPKGTTLIESRLHSDLMAAKQNCETAARLRWFAGKEIFDKFQIQTSRILSKYGDIYKPIKYTFDGLQREYEIPLKNQNLVKALASIGEARAKKPLIVDFFDHNYVTIYKKEHDNIMQASNKGDSNELGDPIHEASVNLLN